MPKPKTPTKPNEEKDLVLPLPYKKDSFIKALDGFIGEIVEVTNLLGYKTRGKCIAITKQHLNIVIEAGTDVMIIKNISSIRREKK